MLDGVTGYVQALSSDQNPAGGGTERPALPDSPRTPTEQREQCQYELIYAPAEAQLKTPLTGSGVIELNDVREHSLRMSYHSLSQCYTKWVQEC